MNAFRCDAGIKQNRIGARLKLSQIASREPQLGTGASKKKHASLDPLLKLIRTDARKRRMANFFCHAKRGDALRCGRDKQIVATQQARIVDLSLNGIFSLHFESAVGVDIQRLDPRCFSRNVIAHQKVFSRC